MRGRLVNVYTDPAWRRQGAAPALEEPFDDEGDDVSLPYGGDED